jgi:putative ABC transport system permease protein
MRPPAPPVFTRGLMDRLTAGLGLRQTSLMILRSIQRWPGRAAVTLAGVAASTALLMLAYFMFDAVDLLGDNVFRAANRQEVTLSMAAPAPTRAVADALVLPGVRAAEGALVLPVEMAAGHRKTTTAVTLHDAAPRLARLIDDLGAVVPLPERGLVLPARLAAKLAVGPGDMVEVRLLVPPRRVLRLPVARLISQGLGQEAHAAAGPVLALLDLAPRANRIDLSVETASLDALRARLAALPAVTGFVDWAEVRRQFDATLAENLLTMVTIYTLIGALITLGVVYNAARIQLAEREHELASLRVLGFTRGEVGFVLVGEMMLLALLAVPVGWVMGLALAEGMMRAVSTDIIQIPVVVTRRTYALAAIATLVAALGAALVVRRHLDRTDIAAVLKNAD